jgi:hypothetical protein
MEEHRAMVYMSITVKLQAFYTTLEVSGQLPDSAVLYSVPIE